MSMTSKEPYSNLVTCSSLILIYESYESLLIYKSYEGAFLSFFIIEIIQFW